jgi:Domain of unknown function (DUF5666)
MLKLVMRWSWQRNVERCFPGIGIIVAVFQLLLIVASHGVFAQEKPAGSSTSAQVAKAVGIIKSLQADSIRVAAESGGEVTAKITASTKILRVPPGEKDLKNASILQAQDLQTGDRVLVRGPASADGKTIAAVAVIVMKQADVAAKQEHDREDWQKRGVGGLVTKTDPATGTVTISSGGLGTSQNIVVHIDKNTILRRYAADSVKFDDAKPSSLDQIEVGDQLRARGTRSPDGNEISAEEVVTGEFRNIAGIVKSVDPAANTITVQDAITKSSVVVRVSADSQMKKLPAEMAQRIAMRLKGTGSGTQPPSAAAGARPNSESQGGPVATSGAGARGSGPPDLQRMLTRLPNSTLADLRKGDAVMIVSTVGTDSSPATVITLLAGVDPILTAAPNRTASSLLSPWSLGASAAESEAAP